MFFAASSLAYGSSELIEIMAPGDYILVGKAVDSDQTYHGKVKIKSSGKGFIVTRQVGGKSINGTAKIEPTNGGESSVLRIRFTEANIKYEQTCLVASDLDNYGRISCYLYRPGANTMQPGLEVLFHDQDAK
ncbi:hypothetical protein [Rhodoferax saidenbachensis]|uniref:Uncharacterized protein n=1 Tax=Rhodoferax saidenbachensis TaxID=1484693 RepID=A0A1P8KAM0_9BURK|nr:hypothetical protein [Rhodoferax saidenbachensis]APW43041.1 hypothetical protein RS694_11200 [Rhodoferax saidenbachensis]